MGGGATGGVVQPERSAASENSRILKTRIVRKDERNAPSLDSRFVQCRDSWRKLPLRVGTPALRKKLCAGRLGARPKTPAEADIAAAGPLDTAALRQREVPAGWFGW